MFWQCSKFTGFTHATKQTTQTNLAGDYATRRAEGASSPPKCSIYRH
jgi:hypothetical protein